VYGGLVTLAVAAVSILAAQRLERMAALSILVSAGTLLAAVGFAQPALTGAALFYLVNSTLALCALFLLAELVERSRSANEAPLDDEEDAMPSPLESLHPPKGINLDDEQKVVIGQIIPWTMAFLGLSFIACALLIIGMPPLSGFVGKLNLINALFNPLGLGIAPEQPLTAAGWGLVALLVLSGMASLIAFGRVGIQRFWKPEERPSPLLRRYECLPIVILLGLCIILSLKAEPLLRYTQDTAASLQAPDTYIKAVMAARPIPGPTSLDVEVLP